MKLRSAPCICYNLSTCMFIIVCTNFDILYRSTRLFFVRFKFVWAQKSVLRVLVGLKEFATKNARCKIHGIELAWLTLISVHLWNKCSNVIVVIFHSPFWFIDGVVKLSIYVWYVVFESMCAFVWRKTRRFD